jgi:hypothetical protein
MINSKFFLIITLVILLAFGIQAQIPVNDTLPASGNTHVSNVLPLHKLHIGVQAGTEFMSTSGYGSALSTWVSPTLTYPLSKRFLVSGGIAIVNTSYYGLKPWYSTSETDSFTGNITSARLWVSGQYLLGDRITITGTAYKTIDVLGANPINNFYKNNPQGAFMKVGYKINDYMQIEAGFGYSRGYNGYSYGSPYSHGFGASDYNPFFNH